MKDGKEKKVEFHPEHETILVVSRSMNEWDWNPSAKEALTVFPLCSHASQAGTMIRAARILSQRAF